MAVYNQLKFGITHEFACSYLPEQSEQLLVVLDPLAYNNETYERLLKSGFRRSGNQIYRPQCPQCSACKSLRVKATEFVPSRSQKRLLNKNQNLHVVLEDEITPAFYPLYERYINERHQDGDMYPADVQQFEGFIPCKWLNVKYLCSYDQDKLIAVSVLDCLPESMSALYTFFDPDYNHLSLGNFGIIKSLQLCQQLNKKFLYLGYQIDACKKMNYKDKYKPYEFFSESKWQLNLK